MQRRFYYARTPRIPKKAGSLLVVERRKSVHKWADDDGEDRDQKRDQRGNHADVFVRFFVRQTADGQRGDNKTVVRRIVKNIAGQ